jgi:hypothetical protein
MTPPRKSDSRPQEDFSVIRNLHLIVLAAFLAPVPLALFAAP